VGVTLSVPVKANSGVRARVPAAWKVLEGDDKPILLREDQHYLHYITMTFFIFWQIFWQYFFRSDNRKCIKISRTSCIKLDV